MPKSVIAALILSAVLMISCVESMDAEEAFRKEHAEMTKKLREKHGISRGGARDHEDMENDMPRMPRMPPRVPRGAGGLKPHGMESLHGRSKMEDDDFPGDADVDHNIGKTRDVVFTEDGSLGLSVVREWGQSHFLIEKAYGQAKDLGVKVGEAIVAINGEKVRWKNLSQLQDQLKKASRPVTVQMGEHRPHGFRHHHPEL